MKKVRCRSGVVLAAALVVASFDAPSVALAAAPPPMPIAPQKTAPPAAPTPVPATTPSPQPGPTAIPIAGDAVIAAFTAKKFPYTLVSGTSPATGVVIHIATGNFVMRAFITNTSKVAIDLDGKVTGTFANCSEAIATSRTGYTFTFRCPAGTAASTPAP